MIQIITLKEQKTASTRLFIHDNVCYYLTKTWQ